MRQPRVDIPVDVPHFRYEFANRRAAIAQYLSANQVRRLNSRRPLVYRRDAGIAIVLRRAGLLHEARTAEHLQRERSNLLPGLGDPALDDRRHQVCARPGPCRILATRSAIEIGGADISHRAHRFDLRLHFHQHAAHIRVVDDGDGIVVTGKAALHPFLRILQRVLVGALRHGQALQPDTDPSPVHHREHAGEAAMRFANQVTDGAVVLHDAGRATVNAELVFDRYGLDAVGRPQTTVRFHQDLGHQEQADSPDARGRVRQTRQHEMDDVVRHVVVAVGDEYLLTAYDMVVALRNGAAADQREVGSRLRLGEVHRTRPGTIDQVRQVGGLQVIAGMGLDCPRRPVREFRTVRPGKVRRLPQFRHRDGQQFRQPLAPEIGIGAESGPASGAKVLKGCPEPVRDAHAGPIPVEVGAFLVSGHVGRRYDLLRQCRGLLERRAHQVGSRLLEARQRVDLAPGDEFLQHEPHVAGRRSVRGHGHCLRDGAKAPRCPRCPRWSFMRCPRESSPRPSPRS